MSSLRGFLLVSLFVVFLLTNALTTLSHYCLNQKNIQEHLDEVLVEIAYSLEALLKAEGTTTANLQTLQKAIDDMPWEFRSSFDDEVKQTAVHLYYKNKMQLQIWKDGTLVLSSKNPVALPINPQTGLHAFKQNDLKWRIFTINNPGVPWKILVAARYDIRDKIMESMIKNYLLVILFTFPIAGFLIWITVGYGLKSLKRVTQELSLRETNYLKPVSLDKLPTEIQPVVADINKLLKRLKGAFEREQRFASDAAHELRTPLAALKIHAQVAAQTKDEKTRTEAIAEMIASVNRCTHLVQQLLTLNRLTLNAAHLEKPKEVNLAAIAIEVVASCVPSALEKEIEISLICRQKVVAVSGYNEALEVLLRNLIDNAIRYTQIHGRVEVHLEETQTEVVLQVMDDGPGIPEVLHERVFERFYRVIGNRSPGSGLGLSIVREIVEMHHGKLELISPCKLGGLCVKIRFPKNTNPSTR